MQSLKEYLKNMPFPERVKFAERCGTTHNYLKKAISKKHDLGINICILIDKNSCGLVRCEDLRPDVDWKYLRGTSVKSDSEKAA